MSSHPLKIKDQNFILHSKKVMYWSEESALLISDVHLGKIAHFRKHGSALPSQAASENYTRLNAVIALFKPKKIYFMGDLFHSSINLEWLTFKNWVKQQTASITLIIGNHDIIDKNLFTQLNINCVKQLKTNQILLTHEPQNYPTLFNICGHIHPGVKLVGYGKQKITKACFLQLNQQLILPAFGVFTGLHAPKLKVNDIAYVIAENEIIPFKKQ